MKSYLFLPLALLKFWYFDGPRGIIGFFASLNGAFFNLFSLPLFLKTYFKPLKNEYRQGLVGFSRVMGMVIKSFFIAADIFVLIPLLFIEIFVIVLFLAFPVMTILLFYI